MTRTFTLFFAACLSLAGTAKADSTHNHGAGCSKQPLSAAQTPAPGLRAFVDPATGELTDPPADGGALAAARTAPSRAAAPALVEVVAADGSVSVDPGDRFMTELRVEIVDGKVVYCHQPLGPASEPHTAERR